VYKIVGILNSGSIHQAKDLINNANVVQAATDMKHMASHNMTLTKTADGTKRS